jgi:hypothetical protein
MVSGSWCAVNVREEKSIMGHNEATIMEFIYKYGLMGYF